MKFQLPCKTTSFYFLLHFFTKSLNIWISTEYKLSLYTIPFWIAFFLSLFSLPLSLDKLSSSPQSHLSPVSTSNKCLFLCIFKTSFKIQHSNLTLKLDFKFKDYCGTKISILLSTSVYYILKVYIKIGRVEILETSISYGF